MSESSPAAESFQEAFCDQFGVPAELYGATVLHHTLYPHARWLAGLSPHEFLLTDQHFVAGVGRLTHWRSFAGQVHAFQSAPENRRFWRRDLRLRVSVVRMRRLFSEVMGTPTGTARHACEMDRGVGLGSRLPS